jgi:hypothetical protein
VRLNERILNKRSIDVIARSPEIYYRSVLDRVG